LSTDNGLLRRLAEASENSNDFQGAQKAWRRYTQQAPQDPEGYLRAAAALWKLDRRAAGLELAVQAEARFASDARFPLLQAGWLYHEADLAGSRQAYRKAVGLSPQNPAVLQPAADGLIRLGELDEAEKMLHSLIGLAPENLEARLLLSKCLLLQKRSGEALQVIQDAPMDTVNSAALISAAVLVAVKEKTFEQAHQWFALAHARQLVTADDFIWLSRAARALAHWDISVQVFDTAGDTARASTALKREMEQAWLAAKEAQSVLQELMGVRTHTPRAAALETPPPHGATSSNTPEPASYSPNADHTSIRFRLVSLDLNKELLDTIAAIPEAEHTSELLTSLAVAQLRRNQPAKALDTMRQVHRLTQLDDWQTVLIALSLLKHGQYGLARKTIGSLQINPLLQPLVQYLHANSWLLEDHTENYCQEMAHTVTHWNNEPLWQFQLGDVYARLDDSASALPHLQQAVFLDPGNIEFLRAMALSLVRDGQLQEGLDTYEEIIRTNPSDPDIFVAAGQLAFDLTQLANASRRFQQADELGADSESFYLGFARTAAARSDLTAALESIRTLLQHKPEHAEGLLLLGSIQRAAGQPDLALEALEKASRFIPESVELAVERARLRLETDQVQQALLEMQQLV